jgi:hypothetical protein
VLVACATNEAPEGDSAAAMTDDTAMLTRADLAGTWSGTTMVADGDSVVNTWTSRVDDSMGKLLIAGTTDSIPHRITLEGDSLVAVSEAYTSPDMPEAPVTFHSIGRQQADGSFAGTVHIRLASNADSVVATNRWVMTRTP